VAILGQFLIKTSVEKRKIAFLCHHLDSYLLKSILNPAACISGQLPLPYGDTCIAGICPGLLE